MSEQEKVPETPIKPERAAAQKWAFAINKSFADWLKETGAVEGARLDLNTYIEVLLAATVTAVMENQKFPEHLKTQVLDWAVEAVTNTLKFCLDMANNNDGVKPNARLFVVMGVFCSREFTWVEEPIIAVVSG